VHLQKVAFLDPTSNRQVVDSSRARSTDSRVFTRLVGPTMKPKGYTRSLDVLANNRGSRAVVPSCSAVIWSTPKLATEPRFQNSLPVELCDGGRYEICVRAGEGASVTSGCFEYSNKFHTEVMLMVDGLTLLGGSELLQPNEAAPVELLIDGQSVSPASRHSPGGRTPVFTNEYRRCCARGRWTRIAVNQQFDGRRLVGCNRLRTPPTT